MRRSGAMQVHWMLRAGAVLLLSARMEAARVFLNSTTLVSTANRGQAFSTRVKASSGWDLMLGRTEDTSVAANYLNADIPAGSLLNTNLTFKLEHRAGQGYVFTVINPLVSGGLSRVLAWGSFSPAVVATSQAALLNGTAPALAANAIRLQSRVSAGGATAGLVLSALNFTITSPGVHTTQGSFQNTTTTQSTTPPPFSNLGAGFTETGGYQSQWILVDGNLTNLSWNLTGVVRIISTNGQQRNENVRLNVTGYDLAVDFPLETPEPPSSVLIGGALVLLGARGLFRKG